MSLTIKRNITKWVKTFFLISTIVFKTNQYSNAIRCVPRRFLMFIYSYLVRDKPNYFTVQFIHRLYNSGLDVER